MNWYKQSKLNKFAEKTLYHGTSINNIPSIQEFGLIPDAGPFVREMYSEWEENGIDLPALVFAADKDHISAVESAMDKAIASYLGKESWEVTHEDLVNYGALIIIPGESGSAEGAMGMNHRDEDEEFYDQDDYPTVEPGDYYSSRIIKTNFKILTGKKMIKFLESLTGCKYMEETGDDRKRKELFQLAMHYHAKIDPNFDRESASVKIMEQINTLNNRDLFSYYDRYYEALRKLV